MTQSLVDDLAQRWRQNPTAAATIALCDALCAVPHSPLVDQVGEAASKQHAQDAMVLLSVAKMYTEAQKLTEAQSLLVNAGKLAPRDGEVYRSLGEVLLRRGDADRAEKVLGRAIQLGARADQVELWLSRARALKPMQAQAGTRAVAEEVAAAFALPSREPVDSESETAIRVLPSREQAFRSAPPAPRPPAPRPPAPPPPAVDAAPPPTKESPFRQAPEKLVPAASKPRFNRDAQTAPLAFDAPPAAASRALPQPLPPPAAPLPAPTPVPRFHPSVQDSPASIALEARPSGTHEDATGDYKAPVPTAPPIPKHLGPTFEAPVSPPNGKRAAPPAGDGRGVTAAMVPHPRDVLDAFALAGIYEPPNEMTAAVAGWDRAAKGPRRKGIPLIIAGIVFFLGGSVGTYYLYRDMRSKAHATADALLAGVEKQIEAGRPDTLADMEAKLAQAFQLESRSPKAALDWARERALVCMVKSGSDIGFEDAIGRAKDLGIAEDKYAFAKVDSFLYQGDTAGAAGVLAKWDGPAGGDAWYQLAAGATLERAGDARARDRYAAAVRLDPELFVAQVALARATAIDGEAQDALRQAKSLRIAHAERAEPVALVALAWGRDPRRDDASPPPEVDDVVKREAELPSNLRFVPHAVAAIRAIAKHADQAKSEVEKGLALADSPGVAVWLGTIALPLGDAALARKAALAALQLSAAYAPARGLAARVALLGGRLDEALKATEELDPTSPDVAIVRAAAAYERADADGVSRALDPVPADVRQLPFLDGLTLAADAIAGKASSDPAKLLALSGDDEAPWGDLVAMDVALDGGDLATCDKIAASWAKDADQNPLRALRLARLARYEGRLDAADPLSQTALDHGTVTPRVLWERVFVLVAKNRAGEVGSLLGRYPLVLGPLATWLSAYAAASNGNVEPAKGKTASVDPLPPSAPLEARVVVAASFGAMKDKHRGADYVKDVLATGSLHPDLVAAALALGFHKVDHGKRKPTYSQ
jgi:tetratricopeptide (TPR) repeat protein